MTSSPGRRRRAALLVAAALSLSSAVLAPAALAAPIDPAPAPAPSAAPPTETPATETPAAPSAPTDALPGPDQDATPAPAPADPAPLPDGQAPGIPPLTDPAAPGAQTTESAPQTTESVPETTEPAPESTEPVGELEEDAAAIPTPVDGTQEAAAASVRLDWGVKASFRRYIKTIAHGSWQLSEGATGEFSFPLAAGKAPQTEPFTGAQFKGRVDFTGHNGVLDLTIADPEVIRTDAGWQLTALVASKPIDSDTKPPLRRFSIATLSEPVVQHQGNHTRVQFATVRLSAEGNKAFDDRYPTGVELDPLTLLLPRKTTARLTDRLAGPNRYATSHAVYASRTTWGPNLVLASGEQFADALAATALAGPLRSPVLLTAAKSLPAPTRASLDLAKQRGVTKIYAVGGTSAISDNILTELRQRGFQVERLAGPNRFATARAVADTTRQVLTENGKQVRTVVLVDGLNFADALAGGPVATKHDGVLLLTNGPKLDPQTLAAAKSYSPNFIAIGGSAVRAAQSTGDAGVQVTPLAGPNRYATALQAALHQPQSPQTVVLASGVSFPDALAGGALAAHTDGVVLLSPPGALPPGVADFLAARDIANVWLTGGQGALNQAVFDGVRAVL
ncbi:cell wall-binding repeat-containing protein [Buchananella hordeovulneris]|uniref:cell wall-binding repeat-containing protein n=1 Tax=Buchananella hordeovulneris TaxID=52770 RepID=UPI0026DB7172|nr:cell wall-binding repeat-containing protein [Buchananella hordeovulneris]MDO5080130.1 cell wall-binding repeat-containing protein [Buchananella hordeovulneris]